MGSCCGVQRRLTTLIGWKHSQASGQAAAPIAPMRAALANNGKVLDLAFRC